MGLIDRLFANTLATREAQFKKELTQEVKKQGQKNVEKISTAVADKLEKSASNTPGVLRYQYDTSPERMSNLTSKRKPDSNVSFDVLRRFSVAHEVSRACINARKRQITQLDWDIVAKNVSDKTNYDNQKAGVVEFFETLGGQQNYRTVVNKVIEDLLVLDAVALYKQRAVNSSLLWLTPVDGSTIRLRVDDSGSTPLPPEIAYKQVIRGEIVAELTTDEMVYAMMNPRTNSPYGLAPLESLIIVVSSALKAGTYNLSYLTDGNIPEGIFNVPENWTPQMIKDFQENWDAAMAGNEMATSKLKFTPGGTGAGYMPTKKPTDMAWGEFNTWLMKVTCAIFDVQPQEIGFAQDVNKANGEVQDNITDRRSIAPLASFLEEIFNGIIKNDLGLPHLEFKYLGLDDKDDMKNAETNEVLIRSGQRTVDELRQDDGLEPIGMDVPIIIGNYSVLSSEPAPVAPTIMTPAQTDVPTAVVPEATTPAPDNTDKRMIELVTELRTFRKMAINRLKEEKPLRPFTSAVLPATVCNEMNKRLAGADIDQAKEIFKEYMQDYQVKFIADVMELKTKLVAAREIDNKVNKLL
jgi:HK97 family phage portal protein